MGRKIEFLQHIRTSLSDNIFVKLTLGDKRSGEPDLKQIFVKRIAIKTGEYLSFTYRYKTRDIVKNYLFDDAIVLLETYIWFDFFRTELFTTSENIILLISSKGDEKLKHIAPTECCLPSSQHDKVKTRRIETKNNIYLRELGVTDENGNIFPSMQDKFKQIDKFIEIIASLVTESGLTGEVNVADMWSWKGYLTFATYDYLSRVSGVQPKIMGIEYRKELVLLCNSIAKKANFDGLQFRAGAIGHEKIPKLNMLIALHACDTATDDAIFQGIISDAEIIVCSPCCHKQIRKQISVKHDFGSVLQNGILEERRAEIVTDGLRALLMEACGYQTKVFEFISSDHTGKNLMITGVKKKIWDSTKILAKIATIKEFFGIQEQQLEKLLIQAGKI